VTDCFLEKEVSDFYIKLHEDGVNDAETCRSHIRLHFCVLNVHLLVL
jgi:hypothetical protein